MKRCIALTIGIDVYAHNNTLSCAVKDARAVEEKLRQLKFETYSLYNQQATLQKFNELKAKISDVLYYNKIDAFVFYFAGHGKMFNATDCLILHDTENISDDNKTKIRAQSIDLKDLCDYLRGAGDQMIIVIIDACRPNGEESARGELMSAAKEFGKNTTLPYQSFLAFSTSPGTSAYEPINGEHSIFTAALLEELPKAQSIETTFKEVRKKVYQPHGRLQIPCETSCLVDDFSFNYGQLEPRNYAPYSEETYDYVHFSTQSIKALRNHLQLMGIRATWQSVVLNNLTQDEAFVFGTQLLSTTLKDKETEEMLTTTKLSEWSKDVLCGFLYAMFYDTKRNCRHKNIPQWLIDRIELLSKNDSKNVTEAVAFIRNFDSDEFREVVHYLPGDKQQHSLVLTLKDVGYKSQTSNIYYLQQITLDGQPIGIRWDKNLLRDEQTLKSYIKAQLNIPSNLLTIRISPNIPNKLIAPIEIINIETDLEQLFAENAPSDIELDFSGSRIEVDTIEVSDIKEENGQVILQGLCQTTITYTIDHEDFHTQAFGEIVVALKEDENHNWHVDHLVEEHIHILEY